ncbi:Fe-S cluster assembly sulfur transfer protein SufU [Deinococcus marmoris]|uniref:Iron-sulfur cluster assembly scaffold protein for SUF system, SufE2 n=1 Tax=Deinococcus marmoris TaxID=249408 RepID=A0A1U7NSJ1_9DEIO|nr:SUF system NifU family Fe-S cluster assembly protein [Deinococcus marmoris]OLV15880.1 iron-sulfur cluster assembly scaffold protein for SUF system, SufE2 [Deinococcus marmoris]
MLPDAISRQIIDDHARRPRHVGELPGIVGVSRDNPGCGDQLTVWADVQEGRIVQLTFQGRGCAISQSAASLMTVILTGKTLAEAQQVAAVYRSMVMGEAEPGASLGDLQALAGVSKLHARRKCALLAWDALAEALDGVSAQAGAGSPS